MKWFVLIFLFFFNPAFSQKIEWSQSLILDENHFKGKIPENETQFAANSMISIETKIISKSIWTGKIKIKIFTTFDPSYSWIKKEHTNEFLLNHEKKHFDIAQIYALKLQKIIDKEIISTVDYLKKFKKLFDNNYKIYWDFQTQYDNETCHGSDLTVQEKYNKLISEMLESELRD